MASFVGGLYYFYNSASRSDDVTTLIIFISQNGQKKIYNHKISVFFIFWKYSPSCKIFTKKNIHLDFDFSLVTFFKPVF
jgi:hypothetical protein